MTKKRDRFFALFGAILFLVTASALTVAVIIDGITRKDDTATQSTAANDSTNANKEKNMLQGTQLENFTPVSKVDSLQVQDVTEGTGDAVKSGDTITADYTGAIASTGKIFQSSLDSGQPFSTAIGKGQVIEGWDEGIIGMKVGGVRRLTIPAAKAYGANPPSADIPPNADLVFDITLHKIGS